MLQVWKPVRRWSWSPTPFWASTCGSRARRRRVWGTTRSSPRWMFRRTAFASQTGACFRLACTRQGELIHNPQPRFSSAAALTLELFLLYYVSAASWALWTRSTPGTGKSTRRPRMPLSKRSSTSPQVWPPITCCAWCPVSMALILPAEESLVSWLHPWWISFPWNIISMIFIMEMMNICKLPSALFSNWFQSHFLQRSLNSTFLLSPNYHFCGWG